MYHFLAFILLLSLSSLLQHALALVLNFATSKFNLLSNLSSSSINNSSPSSPSFTMSSYRMQAVQRGGNEGLESSSGDHALTSHTSLPHINSDGFFTLLPPFVSRASPKKRHHESMVDLPGPRLPQVPVSESYVSSALFTSETSTYAVPSIESSPNRLGLVARRSSSDLSVHSLASLEVTPNGLAEPCHDSHWDAEVTYLNGTHDSDLVREMQPAPCYVPYAQPILAKAASVDSDGIHSLYSETEQCPAVSSNNFLVLPFFSISLFH